MADSKIIELKQQINQLQRELEAAELYPQKIIPWREFADEQRNVLNRLLSYDAFSSEPSFPSQHQLDYVQRYIVPIGSEAGLRYFARDTVENMVSTLVEHINKHEALRDQLGIQGIVTFDSHTNMERFNLEDGSGGRTRLRARGKGNLADQFCIYHTSNEIKAKLAIEYKAPHKFSHEELFTGLQSEICPDHDVINTDRESAKWKGTAVVTQLFSYMVGKEIQYGYIYTGEAFVFLHIPNDPSTVYYSIFRPNTDLPNDNDILAKMHHTAVGQVLAFVLRAMSAGPPATSWRIAAKELSLWPVERDNSTEGYQPSESTAGRNPPSVYVGKISSFVRSPYKLRFKPGAITNSPNSQQRDDQQQDDEYIISWVTGLEDHNLRIARPKNMGKVHAMFVAWLSAEIYHQLMRIADKGGPTGKFVSKISIHNTTTIDYGPELMVSPDITVFQHLDAEYPAVIVEALFSKREDVFDQQASACILGSKGHRKVVVGIKVDYSKQLFKYRSGALATEFRSFNDAPGDGGEALSLSLSDFGAYELSDDFKSTCVSIPLRLFAEVLDRAEPSSVDVEMRDATNG
ncbi:hypothetical protein CHU98_g10916 [Xylaria longipes]|nr:hypothetical protein CHU98_g10916 [Xylaria longipes]